MSTTPTRYEFSPGDGLFVQRLDSDIVDCPVPGYGPGTSAAAAREYVARAGVTRRGTGTTPRHARGQPPLGWLVNDRLSPV